jgi:L-alanine-DL-glutamate epimerase-like enolase superfamily enzyme
MKITAIKTLRLQEFANLLWLFIETDEGVVGQGETFFGPQAVEAWVHETGAHLLLGQDPLRISYLHQNMQGYCGIRGSGAEMRGLSAIDVALWDIWGKATGQPIYQLLGGRTRESVRTYNTCAGYQYIRSNKGQFSENWGTGGQLGPYEDLDAFLTRADELAESLLDQGITGMKIWPLDTYAEATGGLYISAPDLRKGMEPFKKIRMAVGDKIDIMLECHSLWNLPTAVKIARALEEFNPFWIEDPIRMDRLATIGEFKSQTRCPVTASETIAGRWGFTDLIEARGVDIVMLDIGWVGGITEAHAIAQMAHGQHLPFAPHDCTGPIIYTAATHMSVHEPNALIQESVRAFYDGGWFNEVATSLPIMENGYVRPPEGPGLGMELLPDLEKRADAITRRITEKDL